MTLQLAQLLVGIIMNKVDTDAKSPDSTLGCSGSEAYGGWAEVEYCLENEDISFNFIFI